MKLAQAVSHMQHCMTAIQHVAACRPEGEHACVQVRVPTNIVCSISDDRGEEPTFNGVTMSTLIEGTNGVADVISLLWFKRKLPKYATRFIEMCVMLCADHGPCVSGGSPRLASQLRRGCLGTASSCTAFCAQGHACSGGGRGGNSRRRLWWRGCWEVSDQLSGLASHGAGAPPCAMRCMLLSCTAWRLPQQPMLAC